MALKRSPLAPQMMATLFPVKGVRLATAASGIKYKNRDDVMLMVADETVVVAGALTRSKTCSAAVDWSKTVLETGQARGILVNAGSVFPISILLLMPSFIWSQVQQASFGLEVSFKHKLKLHDNTAHRS